MGVDKRWMLVHSSVHCYGGMPAGVSRCGRDDRKRNGRWMGVTRGVANRIVDILILLPSPKNSRYRSTYSRGELRIESGLHLIQTHSVTCQRSTGAAPFISSQLLHNRNNSCNWHFYKFICGLSLILFIIINAAQNYQLTERESPQNIYLSIHKIEEKSMETTRIG